MRAAYPTRPSTPSCSLRMIPESDWWAAAAAVAEEEDGEGKSVSFWATHEKINGKWLDFHPCIFRCNCTTATTASTAATAFPADEDLFELSWGYRSAVRTKKVFHRGWLMTPNISLLISKIYHGMHSNNEMLYPLPCCNKCRGSPNFENKAPESGSSHTTV